MKVLPKLTCKTCQIALIDQTDRFADTDKVFTLLRIKNNGGLIKCSREAYQLLNFTESVLRRIVDIHQPMKNPHLLEKQLHITVLKEAITRNFLLRLTDTLAKQQTFVKSCHDSDEDINSLLS